MVPLNVPNVLTVIRILLVPVLVVALLEKSGSGDLFAAIVFAVASLTDAIDGWLARSQGSVTNFGKLMDPIADKLLIIAALVVLVSLNRLAAWVAMVIIAREFAVTVLRAGVGAGQGIVIPASPFGKAKTMSQVLMVILLIAFRGRPVWLEVIVYLTVAVTVLSGADYFFGLRRRLAELSAEKRAAAGASAAGVSAAGASAGGASAARASGSGGAEPGL